MQPKFDRVARRSGRLALAIVLALSASALASQVPAEPQLVLDPGFHSAMINRVSASADGSRLLSASDDKTARVYDGSGRLLRVLRAPRGAANTGMIYACAISPDGKLAALGGWTRFDFESTHCVYIYDTSSGALLRRLEKLPNVVNHLAFAPTGRPLLAVAVGGSNGVRVFDASTGDEVFRDTAFAGKCNCACFSADASFLGAVGYDGTVHLYKRSGSGYVAVGKQQTQGGRRPFSLAFGKAKAGDLLAVAYNDTLAIDVFKATASELSYAYSPDMAGLSGGGNTSSVAFQKKGSGDPILLAGGTYSVGGFDPIVSWEGAGKGARKETTFGATDSIMDIQTLASGEVLVGSADPFLGRLNPDLTVQFAKTRLLPDFRALGSSFGLSADGSAVDFAYKSRGREPASFSIADRTLGDPVPLLSKDTTSLAVRNWEDSESPTLNGARIELNDYEESRSLAIAPDKSTFLLGCDWYLRCFSASGQKLWDVHAPGAAWGVGISSDGKLAAAGFGDGTIRWFRMDTGTELLAFYAHPDKVRWVAWTPAGYYMASPGAEELIGWHLNQGLDRAPEYYPASRFRSTFYRPDVVALVLSTRDEKAAVAQADAASGRGAQTQSASILTKLPPTIAIVSPSSGSNFSGGTIRVTYHVSAPADAPVTNVRALVDGRPAESAKGLAVVAKTDADLTIDLALPSRSCTVSLIAENKNGSSEAASIQLVRAAAEEFVIKPKLYILAVGVSNYQNPDYRLAYAAKDARDLASAFTTLKGGVYRDVEVKLLADADASKDNILDGLEWVQRQTTAKDVAVLFFSGHGLNDTNQNYYYLPVGINIDSLKRTGVPFSDITNTVSSISGKVLFFIDTCHSGNLMKGRKAVGTERDIAAVVNELASAENGAVVFASSTGSQYSYEDPSWGNGAFTKALIEGLLGKAAYGPTDKVTVNMLDLYISERVKALTGGRQTPTTTKPANVPDFPVALKKN
jgi:WD40 repeat protein